MLDQSALYEVSNATDRLFAWLSSDALPLWSTIGVDRDGGGFVERITAEGELIADVRRARLVARQIFVFRSAGSLGWSGPVDFLVDHGLAALLNHHLTDEHDVVPRYIPLAAKGEGEFDLYDQAFVLFGLAQGYGHTRDPQLETRALAILARMERSWALPGGGFAENCPPKAPLKANPHMHLFEASLAWIDVSAAGTWPLLASKLVDLCVTRFIDPNSGSLHEFFDTDWSILGGVSDVVEPGHQAEWAWLLMRWCSRQKVQGLEHVILRLMGIAESSGLNQQQLRLVNELNADLSTRDGRLRLWPQTERIKALVALYEREPDPAVARKIAQAVEALLGYFEHPIRGSWWEHFDEIGNPVREPARASSLYHIMGAANELARLTGLSLD